MFLLPHTAQPDYKECRKITETLKFLSFLSPIQTLTISQWFPIAYWAFSIAYWAFPIAIGRSLLWIGRSRLPTDA